MNMLSPHPHLHPHVYFHHLLMQNKKGGLLRIRCKSRGPESKLGIGGREVAERDRIISFGKYKGKMLGSLPSSYLKWISSNLRAGDYVEWAELADQVLQDPMYRDRIEWESALNVLNGNNLNPNLRTPNAVSMLIDISHRFGWDNEDKVGWSKVDFDLLGTSRGGRIPRLVHHDRNQQGDEGDYGRGAVVNGGDDSRRRLQRRKRQKNLRLRLQHKENKNVKMDDGHGDGDGDVVLQNRNQNQIQEKNDGVANNRFPGREAFLRNFHRRRGALAQKHNR